MKDEAIAKAAQRLGVDPASVKAIISIESPKGAFLPSGEPPILFERHKFSKHTQGRYDAKYPDISNPQWGGYGKESAQHARLQKAAALDRDAALKSASYGAFQILGENYAQAGFKTIQDFVNAMYESEEAQLGAFVEFIRNDARLLRALRRKDWAGFSSLYNGPAYKTHHYDTRLAEAYSTFKGDAST